jgi:hypothetical protein
LTRFSTDIVAPALLTITHHEFIGPAGEDFDDDEQMRARLPRLAAVYRSRLRPVTRHACRGESTTSSATKIGYPVMPRVALAGLSLHVTHDRRRARACLSGRTDVGTSSSFAERWFGRRPRPPFGLPDSRVAS